jgi:hypothetical protein
MVTVWINGQQHEEIDEGWVNRTIQGLRRDGQPICVRVQVRTQEVNVNLTAGRCDPDGRSGGGRSPRPRERSVLEQWAECSPGAEPNFPPGQLMQCLKKIERLVG